jgi:hypothetical protein
MSGTAPREILIVDPFLDRQWDASAARPVPPQRTE